MKIKPALQKITTNGYMPAKEALAIADRADQAHTELTDMLRRCSKQLGMFMGGEISALLAKHEGIRFNEKEYNFDRTPDGQDT